MSIRNARDEILAFWFENAPDMNKWFMKSRDFDEYIRTEFSSTLERGEELVDWADTPSGFVALIVLLDQFSRQIWRGSPKAFAYDALALRIATSKLDEHYPRLKKFERMFAIMPLMHAEDANAQTRCVLKVEEEAADGDPRLLAAHDQVGVVLRHRGAIFLRVDAAGDAGGERAARSAAATRRRRAPLRARFFSSRIELTAIDAFAGHPVVLQLVRAL